MVRHPERREFGLGSYIEKQEFSARKEADMIDKLERGVENFPDIVSCPNRSCGVPVKVDVRETEVELICSNCGWKKNIARPKKL